MKIRKTQAFTLVELIIGVAISTLVFGASIAAISSLEKCMLASNQYSAANGDQQRVMDYISRDLRSAYTVTVSSSSQTVTATLPDYYGGSYDAQGNPTGSPVTPTISGATITYSAHPLTIVYYISGSSLIRQQTVGATGAVSHIVVSNDVENLQVTYTDLTSTVQLSVTFLPTYQWVLTSGTAIAGDTALSNAEAGTTLTSVVSVRNTRTD